MPMQLPQREKDIRMAFLSALLGVPHGVFSPGTAPEAAAHVEMQKADPEFYRKFAYWYFQTSKLRMKDHNVLFCTTLFKSSSHIDRKLGKYLLMQLRPHEVHRVHDGVKRRGPVDDLPDEPLVMGETPVGVPRSLKTAIIAYLTILSERDLDYHSVRSRRELQDLIRISHINPQRLPGRKAQILAWILDKGPPLKDTMGAVFERVREEQDPIRMADLIRSHRIPYVMITGVLKNQADNSTVQVAQFETMTLIETINHIEMFHRSGLLEQPEFRNRLIAKITNPEMIQRSRLLPFRPLKLYRSHSEFPKDIRDALMSYADLAFLNIPDIVGDTLVLVDKSGSMTGILIELGVLVSAAIAGKVEGTLIARAFDDRCYNIDLPENLTVSEIYRLIHSIQASGMTSIEVALQPAMENAENYDNIVVVTDEEENTEPFFTPLLQKYRNTVNRDVRIMIVSTHAPEDEIGGGGEVLISRRLQDAGEPFLRFCLSRSRDRRRRRGWRIRGPDIVGLEFLFELMRFWNRYDLISEIMATELPAL